MLEKINYKNLYTKTNLAIAIFGILPAAGYLIGISFYEGRLSAYGVNSDAFPLALQDIYVEAFWVVGLWLLDLANVLAIIINKIFLPSGLYLLIGCLVMINVIVSLIIKHKLKSSLFLRDKLKPIKSVFDYLDSEKNSFTKAMGMTGSYFHSMMSILLLILIIAIGWAGIPLLAYQKGQDQAAKAISNYLEKGCFVKDGERWSNCKSLKTATGKLVYEGLLVAHTNGYVAFFNENGSYITKFPEDSVIVNTLSK